MANNDLWIKIKSAFSGEGFKKAEASMKDLGKTASSAGRDVGRISSALGSISGEAGKAAGVVGKLGSALAGGGMWGLAIGAISVTFGALWKKLQDTKEKVKELEQQMVDGFLKQLDIGFNAVGKKLEGVKDKFSDLLKQTKSANASKLIDLQLGQQREQIANKTAAAGLEGSAKVQQQLKSLDAEEKTRQKLAGEQMKQINEESRLLESRNKEIAKSIEDLETAFETQYNKMAAEADKMRAYRHSSEYKGMSDAEKSSINVRHRELKAGLKKMRDEEKKNLEARIAALRSEAKANEDAINANSLKLKSVGNASILGYDNYNLQKATLQAQLKKELADEKKKKDEKDKKDAFDKSVKNIRQGWKGREERWFEQEMRQQEDLANRMNNIKAAIVTEKAALEDNTRTLKANNDALANMNNKQVLPKDAQRAQRLQQRQDALAAKKQENREKALEGRVEQAWRRVRRGMGSSADKKLLKEWGDWYVNKKDNTAKKLEEKNKDIQKKIAENEQKIKQLMQRQQELQQMFIEASANN